MYLCHYLNYLHPLLIEKDRMGGSDADGDAEHPHRRRSWEEPKFFQKDTRLLLDSIVSLLNAILKNGPK